MLATSTLHGSGAGHVHPSSRAAGGGTVTSQSAAPGGGGNQGRTPVGAGIPGEAGAFGGEGTTGEGTTGEGAAGEGAAGEGEGIRMSGE